MDKMVSQMNRLQNPACQRSFRESSAPVRLLGVGLLIGLSVVSAHAQAELSRPVKPLAAPSLITNLLQLRQLTRDQARQNPPVNLQAIVTSFDSQWGALFVGDGQGACYISVTNRELRFTPGEMLAIEGHARPGLTPQIASHRLTVLSNAPPPAARLVSLDDLISTAHDCHRVEVHTVVRAMYKEYERLILHFGESGGRFEAHLANYTANFLPTNLLDARVEITGVVGANFNRQGQLIGIRLYLDSMDDVRILEPAPGDYFSLPPITIKTISLASPASGGRVKVVGTVTLATPSGRLYVEDESGGTVARLFARQPRLDSSGLYLPAPDPLSFHPGDQVEVAGYPALGEYAPVLADAFVRKTGTGPVPVAVNITSAEALTGNYDARLVSLRARLFARAPRRLGEVDYDVLTMQEGDTLFEAAVLASENAPPFKMGSGLRVTGVCDVGADDSRRPRAFRLTLPSAGGIQLLEAPPRFGLGHAVGGVTFLALLALIWSWQLRRKLERQQRQASDRERVEREIRELNASLERRVADRTAELARVAALASASEARTRSVVDTALDAVISMDAAGRITGWNARAEAIFGWSAAEVLGHSLAETIIPVTLREAHRRGLERYLATGEGPALNKLLEVTALRRDGHEFPAELSFSPLQIDGAQHFSGFLRDITDRKRVEAELLQNYAREKELNELKSRFVSMVSHEFRTPLGIIASSAEILDAYLDRLSRDERKSNLQDITDATRHMSRMMEQVLLLGRVEAGKLVCRVGPLDLAVFGQRLVDEVKSQTSNRCPIQFAAAPDLPGAQADEGLLRHIFTNLLSNACKYSPPGCAVEFQIQSRGPLALFTVRDRGIGIPEADARLLFQAFHRGRNVGETPGTGLGMVIVKHCLQLHGGKLAFQSKEGHGTSFVVALPVFAVTGAEGNGAAQLFHKVATDQNLTLVL